jgi:hypothetical protein
VPHRIQATGFELTQGDTEYPSQPLGAVLKLGKAFREGCERADLQQPIKLHRMLARIDRHLGLITGALYLLGPDRQKWIGLIARRRLTGVGRPRFQQAIRLNGAHLDPDRRGIAPTRTRLRLVTFIPRLKQIF